MFARSKRHRKVEEERPKRRTPLKHQYIDAVKFVDDYLDMRDWRVRENANVPYSFSSLFLQAAGETVARYTLSEVYPREIAKAHIEGDFHIHNLPFGIVGYCAGWSIEDLLLHGFSGVRGRTESSPPRHFSSALLQISNFLGSIQNEWAGAQAVNSLDVYLAPFVRKDKLSYKQVKQAMQEFIYNLNISSRWGGQTPFTNVTFELKVPEDMKKEPVIYGGKALDETYADYQSEADLINRAFLDVMLHGDMRGRIFTFPIPTFNITKDFDWDSEVSNLLFAVTAKFGIPYFQNCIKGGIDPREVRSMCCRLMLDLKELHRRYGGFFGYADKTGSIGVCTINMPRLGHVSKDESDFFERLEHLMELAKNSLEIKRKLVEQNMKRGLLPFSARYLGTLKFHFSTIGLVGMHEACLNFIGDGIQTKAGKDFAIKVLKFMRERLVEFQDETGNIYNLEATPAEGTSHHLARLDKKRYPKIITAGKKVPYYTNSTHLPVGYTNNLIEAIRHQDDLQVLYNGGTILHGFLGEAVSSAEGCKTLVRKIAENFRLPYYTITPTFCYDEKTEVLTRDGWKWFKNVKPSDEIATLNIETRELEYQKPIGIYKFRYNGKMVHFKNRNIDLLVTPDHRMLVSSRRSKNKKLYFKGAKDVTQTHNIPLLGIKWKGRDKEFFVLPKVSMPPNYGKLVLDSENCIEKKGHPWTKEEIDFMRKDYAHISPKQLQAVSHRTTDAIKQKAFQSGLKLQTLEIPEKKIPMNDWLRFFGIWLAEGWIKKHPKNGQYLVGISQSTKFYKEIRDLLKRLPS
ncbi:MAG TPA: ribonucleoside triphosphate reductase, partial [Hadesarchaea archaeon]|nr:ribonucleoside triphosphate reductase [Hadesarchaea archaeon]